MKPKDGLHSKFNIIGSSSSKKRKASGFGRVPQSVDLTEEEDELPENPTDRLFRHAFDEGGTGHDDPLYNIASQMLPDRSEIRNAIENVDIDPSALIAAGIIEEEFRGALPDKETDHLTAAAILSGSPAIQEVIDRFDIETIDILDAFLELPGPGEEAGYAPAEKTGTALAGAHRLNLATVVAEIEEIHVKAQEGAKLAPRPEILAVYAVEIAKEATALRDDPFSRRLLERAVKTFNDIAAIARAPLALTIDGEGSISTVKRKDTGFKPPQA